MSANNSCAAGPMNGAPEATVETIILKFNEWLANTPLKPSTRRVYISRLRQFNRFIELQEEGASADFMETAKVFIRFSKTESMLKQNSVNNFLTMFRLMAKIGQLSPSAFEKQIYADAEKTVLSPAEQEAFLTAASRGRSSRNRLLALIFLRTNIRLGESINIKVSDLRREEDTMKICVDGRTGMRIEILDKQVCETIEKWLHERSLSKLGADSEYLFYGADGGPIYTTAMDAALRRTGWQAGLNVSARVLRNTYMNARQSKPSFETIDASVDSSSTWTRTHSIPSFNMVQG